MSETDLEAAQRHVREGEANIARQREHLQTLDPDSDLAAVAGQLLYWLEEMQASDLQHLDELHAKGSPAPSPASPAPRSDDSAA